VQQLAEAQNRTEAGLQRLERVVGGLAISQEDLRRDLQIVKQNVKDLQRDVGTLKGSDQERKYRDKADAIFGRFLRNGRNATNRVADQLYAALQAGHLSDQEV
jgi:hypothetical protein